MVDVTLYGHLFEDYLIEDFQQSSTLGGMANMWDNFIGINPYLKIDIKPLSIGKSLIHINKKTGTRVIKAHWNIFENKPIISPSKWNHIVYLDNLNNTEFIKNLTGIVSSDIATKNTPDLELLKHIDYFFISDDELFMDLKELSKLVKGWVILHYPSGSTAINGDKIIKNNTEVLKNVNVLGAGDHFAASFINSKLRGDEIEDALKTAHIETTNYIKNKL